MAKALELQFQHQSSTLCKTDKEQGATDSTENYIQYLVINYNGQESEKEHICIYIHVYVHIYTHTRLHAQLLQSCPTLFDLWTIAQQAPLSMGFSRQENWSGLLCPPPGDLPDPGIEPISPVVPALQARFFTH